GVVITHGTSTLEETAYFLHLTIPTNKPVVLVGAQRPYSSLSSDAHLNLIQAIKVATSDESYNKGVLVALNNEITSAREESKSHTYQVQAFTSLEAGVLGRISPDDTIQHYRKPRSLHTVTSESSHFNQTTLQK